MLYGIGTKQVGLNPNIIINIKYLRNNLESKIF